jgi:hypothetical protein
LNSWRRVLLRNCYTRFFSFLGQIGGFPAKCKFGGQPSKSTKLHVLLGDGFHFQTRSDHSHGWSAKYTGNINKPGFCGRLFFSLDCYWSSGSSSRGGFWPPFFYRRRRLAGASCLLCLLRHDFFDGGGWDAASLSRSAHCVLVVLCPLIHGVRRWNLLRQLQIEPSACSASRQVLDYSTRGTYLGGCGLCHLSFLVTRIRATLHGLLGCTGLLASKLFGGSSTRGTWGSPGRLNLDRS